MKQRSIEVAIIVLLLAAVLGLGYWLFSSYPEARQLVAGRLDLAPPQAKSAGITASGFIEVRQVAIAPEVGGRVARLSADKGDRVTQGQVLVELDAELLDAQIAEAQAAVAMAEAQLARVEAGARTEDVAVAGAAVVMAEAGYEAANRAWQDAVLLRDNPQQLDLQIASTRSQIDVLEHRIQQMSALKDASELVDDLRERQVTVIEEGIDWSVTLPSGGKASGHAEFPEGEKRQAWSGWNLATTDLWSAWVSLNQAIAAREAAQQNLSDLLALRANPQQANVQVIQSKAAVEEAAAAVKVAEANLDRVRAGATREQIDLARTGVEQARAALDTLRVQRQKYMLRSPTAGMVMERVVHQGENVVAGTTLLTLGNLDTVDLTIYIPEPDVGQVFRAQPVEVSVDTFPDETFPGQVVWISEEAEFTPKNVQTKEERVSTVFAVKVRIPNHDHKLKPGMPADAVLLVR